MKSKFVLVSLILLSLLHQGYSQKQDIHTIMNMPAKYAKVFGEGREIISDLIESENLQNLGEKIIFHGKRLTDEEIKLCFNK